MSEDKQPEHSPLPVEVGVAILAGGLSWIAVPATGVTMHWGVDGAAGWTMGASVYAIAAAVLTFLMGHFITQWVSHKIGFSFVWPAPLASAVLWIGYAALQRIWPGFIVVVLALVLAVAVYFLLFRLGLRGSSAGSAR